MIWTQAIKVKKINIWLITVWDGNDVLDVIPLQYNEKDSQDDIVSFAIKERFIAFNHQTPKNLVL